MDIAEVSMNMAQSNAVTTFSTAMLDKSLDLVKDQGALLSQSIASAPSPSLESLVYPSSMGTHIDTTV